MLPPQGVRLCLAALQLPHLLLQLALVRHRLLSLALGSLSLRLLPPLQFPRFLRHLLLATLQVVGFCSLPLQHLAG